MLQAGRRLFLLFTFIFVFNSITISKAEAFESGPEPKGDEGPGEVRKNPPWGYDFGAPQDPPNEHAQLLRLALARSGIPAVLDVDPSSSFSVTTYSISHDVEGGFKSLLPSSFRFVNAKNIRNFTIAGFASLPDHSYSIADWASGNEVCPPGTVLEDNGPKECHSFRKHLGTVNSTHFPPQADANYRWYHRLALTRAAACRDLGQRFLGATLADDHRVQAVVIVQECERESLLIEAVGQHFLQDSWAIGHMWERWGYASIDDFPQGAGVTASPVFFRWLTASVVALMSGTIHGAEGVFTGFPDLLSGGRDPNVRWAAAGHDGGTLPGIGDVHLDELLSNPSYAAQRESLLNCSASGLREVYAATAKYSSADPGAPLPPFVGEEVVSTSPKCLGQRATNSAMYNALFLRCGSDRLVDPATPAVTKSECIAADISSTIGIAAGLTVVITDPLYAALEVPKDVADALRKDMVRITTWAALRALQTPDGTDLAEGAYSDATTPLFSGLLNVPRNGLALNSTPPGPYADPEFPWPEATDPGGKWRPEQWLGRTFHNSHSKEWCENEETGPVALVERVASLPAGNEKDIACQICIEFVSRHVQLTSKPDTSLCVAAGAYSAPIVASIMETSVESAARTQCQCNEAWDVARDFDTTNNPHSVWEFGRMQSFNFGFERYDATYANAGVHMWYLSGFNVLGTPSVLHCDTTGNPEFQPFWQPGIANDTHCDVAEVNVHPSTGLLPYSAVRFTAPTSGVFEVEATFSSRSAIGATTDVYVIASDNADVRPNPYLLSRRQLSAGSPAAVLQSTQIVLTSGEKIMFVVGPGWDEQRLRPSPNFQSDSTGLNAKVRFVRP